MGFLSPGERRILAELDEHEIDVECQELGYFTEGDVVRLFMETFDAHMLDIGEPRRAVRADETEQMVIEEQLRDGLREMGRRAWNWD